MSAEVSARVRVIAIRVRVRVTVSVTFAIPQIVLECDLVHVG